MNVSAIIDAMAHQVRNPRRAFVNAESAFVKDALVEQGHTEEANAYWAWETQGIGNKVLTGAATMDEMAEIINMSVILVLIDKGHSMPEWGTYGT